MGSVGTYNISVSQEAAEKLGEFLSQEANQGKVLRLLVAGMG